MREFVRFLVGLGLLLGVVVARADWVVDGEASGQAATAEGESPVAGANVSVSNSSPQVTVINSGANGKTISLAVSDADNAAYVKAVTGKTAGPPVALNSTSASYFTANSPDALNFDTDDPFSIEAWVYCKSDYYKESYHEPLIGKLDGSDRGWMLNAYSRDLNTGWEFKLVLTDTDGSYITRTYRTAQFSVSTWFHVVGTYDGSGLKEGINVYVDAVASVNSPGSSGTMDTLTNSAPVGVNGEGNPDLYGLDEIVVWNQELSGAQVATRYNSGAGAYLNPEAAAVGIWHFDEDLTDSSATGADLLIQTGSELYRDGVIPVPPADVEVDVVKVEDGTGTGAEGTLTYGNPSADTVIEGGMITVDGPATFVDAVGIGTTNPVEKFEVQWDAAVDVMIGRATNDTDQTFISLRSADGTQWYITANDTGTVSAVTTKP